MKKGTNEPTLSDVLKEIGQLKTDLFDMFDKAGVKDAEPTEPEWEDLTVTWTLNKEQAIEMWHRLNIHFEDVDFVDTDILPAPDANSNWRFWGDIDKHLIKQGIKKE